ncbi:MAG: glycosyltransferase 87 family protein [Propionibacteriaceae bacterium]|nr:glycosyltransferase 87 family protein [Propionibacteriaceae bacterium]
MTTTSCAPSSSGRPNVSLRADPVGPDAERAPYTAPAVLRALLVLLPPLLSSLWIAAVTIPGGSFVPWEPAMIDLDVYRRTGALLLEGRDFYAAEGLPWIYPPFAALFTIPLALLPLTAAELVWIALTVGLLVAILYRLGLSGWVLSLAATAAVWFVEPVRETLGFGQLGVLLVGAAVLDSMPGRRVLPRRFLPEGVLVGIATAVKLTPATVAATLFFAGRRRPGLVAFFTFLAATGLAFLVLPAGSLHYWGGLASGDSGINAGIIFHTNQSIMGAWARVFGELSQGGLVLSAIVAVLGIASAAVVHRAGEQRLAICVAGITSLLASPISWSHHYVWIVPVAVVLLQDRHLARWLRVFGLLYAVWVMAAPFKQLPGGDGVEATYALGQQVVVNLGVVAGLVFVLACGVEATRGRRARRDADQGVLV